MEDGNILLISHGWSLGSDTRLPPAGPYKQLYKPIKKNELKVYTKTYFPVA